MFRFAPQKRTFVSVEWHVRYVPQADRQRVAGQARWAKVDTKDYKSPRRSRKAASIATWSVLQSDRYAEP